MLLLATSLFVLRCSLSKTDSHVIYVLDDAYIHMAIAKNLAEHGVFGVTQHAFTSSSSSLLWPLLLALIYTIFGVNAIAPLVLNLLFAVIGLYVAHRMLMRHSVHLVMVFFVLVGIVLLVPLVPVIFLGMEHTLHMLIMMVFFYVAAVSVSCADDEYCSERRWLLVLAPVLMMTRYEGVFAVFAVCMLLALRRRHRYALAVGLLGLLPVSVFAVISVANGWFAIPNSVLGHASGPSNARSLFSVLGYLVRAFTRIANNNHLFIISAVSLFLYVLSIRRWRWFDFQPAMISLFLITLVLHTQLAELGMFYRYEAYLMGVSVLIVGLTAAEFGERGKENEARQRWLHYVAIAALVSLFVLPLGTRGVRALQQTPTAAANIYEQQYQMGMFVREYYTGRGVGTNDVGVVNYLADIRHLDLLGLTNIKVARARMFGEFGKNTVASFGRDFDLRIAIIYDHWFHGWGGAPSEWTKVCEWTISNNVVCGGATVSFYATDSLGASNLVENLRSYAPRLPAGVSQAGPFVTGDS
ncbi:MAG: hypothetical protein GTO51_07410 [Candidatus Latescibacteria bacterium]|nr:hypothetical protein [Candidatus Latescibacterota bacterium]NIM65799.1 hypothetical protein [Candidatus Latescibacterota bacterium]NIO02291.1 hypothetical protein [Candidatus Latescibacterota bacterium]NIO29162.1 hypothetical protein [Candidatus Latescibacterota bacterium]NIO56777.1 hypothetical protein [Candidatus Latescibacterota bacterium]